MTNIFALSIIITTYNRAHIIEHCLQSLVDQTVNKDLFEVIVINNNCTDNTDKVVQRFEGKIKNLKLIHENKQGLSYARNAGIAVANAQWIASLDDDAKSHNNWVEVILREITNNNFDAFGGPYLAWHHYGPAPKWFDDDWGSNIQGFRSYGLMPNELGHTPTGGNCVFKKEVIMLLGGFPTKLGMAGNKCAYGEETKLFEDMRSAGFKLGSVPDMIIDHCVLPYKYTLKWQLNAAYAHGIASPYILLDNNITKTLIALIKQILLVPKRIFQGINKRWYWQRITLETLSPILNNIGQLKTKIKNCMQKT